MKTSGGYRTFLMGRSERERVEIEGPVRFVEILSFKADIEVGQHGCLRIDGMADQKAVDEWVDLRGAIIRVLSDEGAGQMSLFAGYITQYTFQASHHGRSAGLTRNTLQVSHHGHPAGLTRVEREERGGILYLCLTAVSGTIRFDQERRTRMFQDVSMTYRDIWKEIAGEDRTVIGIKEADKRPGYPLFQYQETDWQFLKRIASTLRTILIPEVTDPFPQLSIGVVTGREYTLEDTCPYRAEVDYKRARERKREGMPTEAFASYKVSTDKDFRLGDKIIFKKRRWVVLQKEIKLEKGMLVSAYQLGSEQTRWEEIKNDRLCGAAFPGRVLQTEGEKIKLHLDIDERQPAAAAKWFAFDYVPITGNLLYSMPEPGAKVSLYFPGPEESHGMVIDSIQKGIVYPDHEEKVMELPSGVMMGMDPDQMLFSVRGKGARMRIKDSQGISLRSGTRICLQARGRIRLTGEDVGIASRNSVFLKDGDGDSMEIKGRRVTFRSPRYRLSAVRHRTIGRERSMADYLVIRELETVACAVMGGIPLGELDGIEAKIRAGIPAVLDPDRPYMDRMAQISWRRE